MSMQKTWGQSGHLTYLEKGTSFFEDAHGTGQKQLLCASCEHLVTRVSEKIDVRGRHQHSFTNLGYLVKLGCFRKAPGCTGVQNVSYGYSWFPGYAWQIQVCENCYSQVGWKYMTQYDSFYGLVFGTLREQDLPADGGGG